MCGACWYVLRLKEGRREREREPERERERTGERERESRRERQRDQSALDGTFFFFNKTFRGTAIRFVCVCVCSLAVSAPLFW